MKKPTWRDRVEADAGNYRRRPLPHWEEVTPYCDDVCSYHDGKRCELLGHRPESVCEPVVAAMGRELENGAR